MVCSLPCPPQLRHVVSYTAPSSIGGLSPAKNRFLLFSSWLQTTYLHCIAVYLFCFLSIMFRENAEVLLRHFQFNNNDKNKYKTKSNAQNDSTFKLGKPVKAVYICINNSMYLTPHIKLKPYPIKNVLKGQQYKYKSELWTTVWLYCDLEMCSMSLKIVWTGTQWVLQLCNIWQLTYS